MLGRRRLQTCLALIAQRTGSLPVAATTSVIRTASGRPSASSTSTGWDRRASRGSSTRWRPLMLRSVLHPHFRMETVTAMVIRLLRLFIANLKVCQEPQLERELRLPECDILQPDHVRPFSLRHARQQASIVGNMHHRHLLQA